MTDESKEQVHRPRCLSLCVQSLITKGKKKLELIIEHTDNYVPFWFRIKPFQGHSVIVSCWQFLRVASISQSYFKVLTVLLLLRLLLSVPQAKHSPMPQAWPGVSFQSSRCVGKLVFRCFRFLVLDGVEYTHIPSFPKFLMFSFKKYHEHVRRHRAQAFEVHFVGTHEYHLFLILILLIYPLLFVENF